MTPRMLSCRVVFLTSYFTAVVLLAGYSAFLISFLATRETKEFPFTSFKQFLVDGRYQLGMLSDSAFTFYFEVGINHYCVEITFILHLFTDFPYPFCTFISFPLFPFKTIITLSLSFRWHSFEQNLNNITTDNSKINTQ